MVSLVISLIFGAIIVLLASSNAHMVETRLGPLTVVAPHFVALGISFFLGFAIAVVAVLGRALKRNDKKTQTRSLVIKR
jgi:uncharacterized integral membrane protein